MKVLYFNGGLGNQMFQYAFYLGEKKKHDGIWVFDRYGSRGHHQGFELERVFGLCKFKKLHNSILRLLMRKRFEQVFINETDGAYFQELPRVTGLRKVYIYRGFWQSEKYFLNVESNVRRAFQFDKSKLNEQSAKLSAQIARGNNNYISVHIRRGDYMDDPDRQVCTLEYYKNAMSYLKKRVNKPCFIVFSDDISWCKEQFGSANDLMLYVDWNNKLDSWQDMYLMSKCKHHIIANSSFSWWGAWLDDNESKIVICPQRWNVDYPEDTDKVPVNWIRM